MRRLLLGIVQRPVGKVGVHPSAPIDENTYRKRLKTKELELFQNGAVSVLFETGSPRAKMGRDWANQWDYQRRWQEALELQLEHLIIVGGRKIAEAD